MIDNVVAAEHGSALRRLKNGGQHAQRGGFAGAVGAQQAVNFSRLTNETDMIHSPDYAALLVLEAFAKSASFNHFEGPHGPGLPNVLSVLRGVRPESYVDSRFAVTNGGLRSI
jgi:hypothetical protein